jgi:hypothetical protein
MGSLIAKKIQSKFKAMAAPAYRLVIQRVAADVFVKLQSENKEIIKIIYYQEFPNLDTQGKTSTYQTITILLATNICRLVPILEPLVACAFIAGKQKHLMVSHRQGWRLGTVCFLIGKPM